MPCFITDDVHIDYSHHVSSNFNLVKSQSVIVHILAFESTPVKFLPVALETVLYLTISSRSI